MNSASDTRERLLDAAADILETEGLAHLNTNALADRAGVTPPTVYRNFKNKEEVMECLARRFIEAEKSWLLAAEATFGEVDALEGVVDAIIELYWESARRQRGIVALRSAMRVWPALKRVEEASLQSSASIVAKLLAPYMAELKPRQQARVARHATEIVCSTVDRCYSLEPREQAWRIGQLKLTITAYLRVKSESVRIQ